MRNEIIYFPGLNGIRAIAALAVVITHITIALGDFGLDPYVFGSFQDGKPKGYILGGYGVSIFFVLSGFLITYLLLCEKDFHPINIKKFYLRRILRIWPLYYLYLFVSIVVILIYGLDFNIKSLILYLFYAANVPFILATGLPFIGHYWSLGVEEQFYLFWPWIVKKSESLILLISFMVFVLIGIKLTLHLFKPNTLLESIIHVTRFHCMMIGAIGAILLKKDNALFLKTVDNKITQSFCWFIFLLLAINKFHFISVIDNEIISVVALFLIIGQIRVRNRIINLENNLFDFLGKISYGIYVVHPLLIYFFSILLKEVEVNINWKYLIVYFIIISSTILVSFISFEYFEKFFLRLKKNFVVVKSSGTKNEPS